MPENTPQPFSCPCGLCLRESEKRAADRRDEVRLVPRMGTNRTELTAHASNR
jgi:hypothetical protein